MRLKSILFALAAMIGSSSAMAGPVTCYVEGTVGVGIASSKMSMDTVGSLDGLSSNGVLYAPGAGCDYRISDKMILGVMTRYDFGTLDTTLTWGTTELSAKLKNQWMVGARFGVELNPVTIGYVLAGYGGAKVDLGDPDFNYDPKGKVVGAGIEWMIPGSSLVGKVEYSYTMYDKKSFDLGGPAPLDVKTDAHAVRFGLVYRFLDTPSAAPMK